MCLEDCSCRFSKTYSKYKLSFVGKCDKFERFINQCTQVNMTLVMLL